MSRKTHFMKNITIIFLVFTNFCFAQIYTNFEEAKKIALVENKLMLVDFTASWCGPCREMEKKVWPEHSIKELLNDFVFVQIDIDINRDLKKLYDVKGIPYMVIMDANGKLIKDNLGDFDVNGLKRFLNPYRLSTQYLSNELIFYHKSKNYNTSIRVFQKYLDFYLMVDKELQYNFLQLGDAYFEDAQYSLSKKDENYLEKRQKLDLFSLYNYAYLHKFKKLDIKLSSFKESEILENNLNLYYFLVYISAKAQHKEDFVAIEAKVASLDGFESYIGKANFILSKHVLKE